MYILCIYVPTPQVVLLFYTTFGFACRRCNNTFNNNRVGESDTAVAEKNGTAV